MLHSLKGFDENEAAQRRMKIIKFYEEYGEKAAKEAFGADRKVVSRWRKRLAESGGKLEALIVTSTRPRRLRTPVTNLAIVKFIRRMREEHPRLGKEKIKVLLDEHCKENGIKTVSESTVGNVIKRHKFFFQRKGRIYHNPASGWAKKVAVKEKRLRIRHSPKPEEFGHILSDTVTRITDGVHDYFISAIDAKLKFAVTLRYKRLTSRNMLDFYWRFKGVYPCRIKVWQSDNGGENLGEFNDELKKDGIPHLFIYPNCPKVNTYIERYNRTIQEEFIDNNLDTIHDEMSFNPKLADYLIFYNTKRPHKSLGLKSPIDHLIEKGGMSQMCLTYTGN